MRTIRLDAETANRLVSGQLSPDDAPPGYGAVAQLLAQARTAPGPPSASELATVAAMRQAVLGHLQPPTPSTREKKMLAKVLTVKGAVVAGAVLLGTGTAAAAATGSLPSPAQNALHHALSHLDVSVPDGNGNANGTDHAKSSSHSGTPNSHALPGLCNAAAHNGTTAPNTQGTKPNSHSVFGSFSSTTCTNVKAPGNSANAGTGATPGSEGSDDTTGPSGSGTGQGQGGKPTSVPPGPPTSVSTPAPVPTPNQGSSANQSGSGNSGSGLNTANTNDGGASSTGSGAASSGSGNTTSRR